ncbi:MULTISPECIES: penicillin-binding transpeptidase domain-containing protein [Rheinheimera]|uniref:Peptidoglycan D,D-transpeptidase FtsI n=1 Tax=Rheinheimera marina TaxID=1774958 RepID=A0ABV9JPB3_9GAMM
MIKKPTKAATPKRQAKKNQQPAVISWRFAFVIVALLGVFSALVIRSAYLQVIEPEMLLEQGDARTLRVKADAAMRGMILDRHGEELAVSVPSQSIWADPQLVLRNKNKIDQRHWHALAEMLRMTPQQLSAKIGSDDNKRFVYLQRQASPATVDYIRQLKIPGIAFKQESRRYYPAGEVTAHLLGFTNVDEQGMEGIERQFNDYLTGTPATKTVRKDAKGREIEVLKQTDGEASKNLQLSIDQRIQAVAYRELKKAVLQYGATSGSVVVVDVHTGEVLAMANAPSYNPNNRKNSDAGRYRNRAITDTYEPGSTIKPLPVLAALENGTATMDTVISTGYGPVRIGGRLVRDIAGYGDLDLTGILRKSSNIGVSRLALDLPVDKFLGMYYKMGIGQETGLGLTGETPGTLREQKRWGEHALATVSFGYSFTVNAVQLVRAYAAIANGGILRPLTIIKQDKVPPGERVLSEQNAENMWTMLEAVVGPGGGGKRAVVPGYRVGGKTGTAKKAGIRGYSDDYIGSFVGIAPISNPRLACIVIINEPSGDYYYGGEVAAPVFGAVMGATLKLLNIAPDANDSRITQVTGGDHAG